MEYTKRVGIWVRVSTDFQVKDDSPETHEKRARLYAEAKGWDVVEVYRLEAVSGKSVMENIHTKKMLKDIQSGRITGLIFSKLARLARNTKELLEFSEIFRTEGADLISLSENIDTSSPAGRLFYTMIAAMAEWERAEIADRVAASVPIRAKMGKPLGGQAPYGYQWVGKELVVDEKEAPVRKLMYDLFTVHHRKGTVAKMLNEQGYRTRNGSLFSDTTIGRLLRDSTAKGSRRANYTRSLGDNKKWVIKPENEWIVIPCPAIVPEDLWNDCNRILDEQERKNKRPTKKVVHLFTGIVFCECGSKMLVPSDGKKYICHTCRKNRIAKDDLEEIYYENLKSYLLTDAEIGDFLTKADAVITDKELQLETLNQEQKRLKGEMDKLIDLHRMGQIPTDGFGAYYNPLDTQLRQVQNSIPEIQAEIDFLKIEYLNSDVVMHEAQTLYDRWPTFSPEDKRQIVEQITDRITIGGDEIKFKFSYNPSLFQNTPDSQRNFMGSSTATSLKLA
ncbi:MAG: recombinase family protein [Bacteroidetes bacterium]|nr:recombinase family protein [Bacteroidota bacterium]